MNLNPLLKAWKQILVREFHLHPHKIIYILIPFNVFLHKTFNIFKGKKKMYFITLDSEGPVACGGRINGSIVFETSYKPSGKQKQLNVRINIFRCNPCSCAKGVCGILQIREQEYRLLHVQ